MNRLNCSWVFSDGIKGHEVQSLALAESVSQTVKLFHCAIRQPWLTFAPRILPRFGRNLIWEKQPPDMKQRPDAIITCGRRMAAVGKYHARKLKVPQIQILNPGDSFAKYKLLILPEHDQKCSENIITVKGSLHSYSCQKLNELRSEWSSDFKHTKPLLAFLVGHPNWADLTKELKELSAQGFFNEKMIHIVASRRTRSKDFEIIRSLVPGDVNFWRGPQDGENPYQGLLACADEFLITADSVNMISEVCGTKAPVILTSKAKISPKHQHFIKSLGGRVCGVEDVHELNQNFDSLWELPRVSEEVLKKLRVV